MLACRGLHAPAPVGLLWSRSEVWQASQLNEEPDQDDELRALKGDDAGGLRLLLDFDGCR